MKSSPRLITTPADLRKWRSQVSGRVGFVPTMGALHEGHCELLRRARAGCDQLALSIFVNPTQFGPNEDFEKYPRTLELDIEKALDTGVDVIFHPQVDRLYHLHHSTSVVEEKISAPLCGPIRPGHFRGVATIVLKLFNLLKPHFAYFGTKDAQQFFMINRMVRDLDLDVRIIGVPTIREHDGLALSSRNRYLSESERKLAPFLYQTLANTVSRLENGQLIQQVLDEGKVALSQAGFQVQYLDLLELPDFLPAPSSTNPTRTYLLAVAALLGKTRLIDNILMYPNNLVHGVGRDGHPVWIDDGTLDLDAVFSNPE